MDYSTELDVQEIIEKLDSLHEEAQKFNDLCSKQSIKRWHDRVRDYLAENFFDNAVEEYFLEQAGYRSPGVFWSTMTEEEAIGSLNLPKARKAVRRLMKDLQADDPDESALEATVFNGQDYGQSVFIVHGHNENVVLKVKSVLASQDLVPIVLAERPNGGATIIEKFEREADVGFAVVVLSQDDLGKAKNSDEWSLRCRQNVLLELGYFIGKLGRNRVCALREADVELPSDIFGVVYTDLDVAGHWKYSLADELQLAGYKVDKNKI